MVFAISKQEPVFLKSICSGVIFLSRIATVAIVAPNSLVEKTWGTSLIIVSSKFLVFVLFRKFVFKSAELNGKKLSFKGEIV